MSNKTQLQTNNTTLDDYIARINAAKETAASLPEAGSGGGSVETCTVTMNTAVPCRYLGIDLQPKTETTSTFETVKNSIAVINGEIEHHDFFGYTLVLSEGAATVVQLNETIVNLTIRPTSGGAD